MRAVTVLMSPRSLARTVALLTVGLIAANCSSDSTRLNDNPFANRPNPPETTGSVPPGQGASYGQIESRPLAAPPMAGQPLPPPANRRPGTYGGGMSGGGQGMGSFQPSADYGRPQGGAPEVTGAVPRLRNEPKSSWNWEGGTPITIAPGDTLASLSQRYGVPAPAIAEANGLTGPAALRPGQRLVIPRYIGPAAAAQPAPQPVATAPSNAMRAPMSGVHVVGPGETMVGIARRYHVPIAQLAAANNIAPHAMLKMGDRLVVPGRSGLGGRTAAATPELQPAPAPVVSAPTRQVATAPVVEKLAPVQQKVAQAPQAAPTETIQLATPASEAVGDDERRSVGGAPAFRWPVKGRVIANFGSKTDGQQNDGINLAVPEGTAVRASEDGVVAYAGSELKGYGNLILVRHSNGFVTAYAHASEIMVKRNDQVRRGQIIAKSGQTGSVSSPQLHFEIRKGSSPIDPMQHLAAGG